MIPATLGLLAFIAIVGVALGVIWKSELDLDE